MQGYNAQAAVDGAAQVIVAQGLTNSQSDQDQLTVSTRLRRISAASRSKVSADPGQFLLRGIDNVRAEWAMICTAHNLLEPPERLHESEA